MSEVPRLDSFGDACIDQCDGGVQRHWNGSWEAVGDTGDLGRGSVLIDQQSTEFDSAAPELRPARSTWLRVRFCGAPGPTRTDAARWARHRPWDPPSRQPSFSRNIRRP